MFCSSPCLIQAFNSYLLFESKLDLGRMFPQTDLLPAQYLLPVRLLLLGQGEAKPSPSYGSGLRVDSIDALTSLGSLMTHEDRLTSRERIELAVTSLVLAQCLQEAGTEVSVLQVARMVLRVRCNAHQVMMVNNDAYDNNDDDQVDEVTSIARARVELEGRASAVYPVLPLLNHSCDPNTLRVYNGGRVLLIAAR